MGGLLVVILILLIALPVGALQLTSSNHQGAKPPKKGDTCKYAPRNRLSLWLDMICQGKKPAGDEGADATTSSGKCLGNAVQCAEGFVRRGRICDLQ